MEPTETSAPNEGTTPEGSPNPFVRNKPSEQVAFVEFDPGFDQQFSVFLLERFLTVMFFLHLDVLNQPVAIASRAGKRCISLLPVRKPLEYRIHRAEPVLISLTKSARRTAGWRLVRM
jgi:hypothetical protein